MFVLTTLLGWIPPSVLAILTATGAAYGIMGFRKRRAECALLTVWGIVQFTILLAWVLGLTAVTCYEASPQIERRVVSPDFERIFMTCFWIIALLVILGLVILASRCPETDRSDAKIQGRRRKYGVALLLVSFLCMPVNVANFRRMEPSFTRTHSPDGSLEVSVVPIWFMVDTRGLLICQKRGELWWHPVSRLQLSSGPVSLSWLSDSELIVDWAEQRSKYDLITGKKTSMLDLGQKKVPRERVGTLPAGE